MEGLTDPLLSVDIRYHQQSKTIDDYLLVVVLCFVTATKRHVFPPKMCQVQTSE